MKESSTDIKKVLADILISTITDSDCTQTEIATMLNVTQPRISSLVRGEYDKFSLEYIVRSLKVLGYNIQFNISSTTKVRSVVGTRNFESISRKIVYELDSSK